MDETLIKKLTAIVESQKQLEDDLSKVDISSDPNKYEEMAKKHSDMSSIVELFRQWETLTSDISDAEELLNEETDEEMKSEYEDIIKNSTAEIENIVTKIKVGFRTTNSPDCELNYFFDYFFNRIVWIKKIQRKNKMRTKIMNTHNKHIFKIEILAKDKQLLFYEWHVQKASEKNCKDCWFTSGVSMPTDQGNTI